MQIMTKTQYDAVCDIVMEQKRRLEEKEDQIKRLEHQIAFLENLVKYSKVINITIDNSTAKELRFGD